jgi:hypothetical protein
VDLTTILRALAIVGETTEAGTQLFEGFMPLVSRQEQALLIERYTAAGHRQSCTRVPGEFEH